MISTSTKDNNLEVKSNNKNQVDDEIVRGLGEGFLSLNSSLSANTIFFYPGQYTYNSYLTSLWVYIK